MGLTKLLEGLCSKGGRFVTVLDKRFRGLNHEKNLFLRRTVKICNMQVRDKQPLPLARLWIDLHAGVIRLRAS